MNRWLLMVLMVLLGTAAGWLLHEQLGEAARDALTAAGAAAGEDDDARADDDDDDDDAIRERRLIEDGRRRIRLTTAERDLADIALAAPAAASAAAERRVPGVVLDRAALAAAQDALAAHERALDAARGITQRLRARRDRLREMGGSGRLGASRELAEIELALVRQQAAEIDHQRARDAARAELVARWGAALVGAAGASAADGDLVAFALPADAAPPAAGDAVLIAADGERAGAMPATVIAPAPGGIDGLAGRAWYAQVSGADLRRGMRVDVWLAAAASATDGVLLPSAALVWHGGRRWYYAAVDALTFERRALPPALAHAGGVVVAADAVGSEPVVVRGALSLLGEEFRGAIPDEDED